MTDGLVATSGEPRRLALSHALFALLAAFLLAQLAGKLMADVLGASKSLQIAAGDAVNGLRPEIVVPSMVASELAILLVALLMPLLAALPLRETLGIGAARPQLLMAAAFGTVMLGPLGDTCMSTLAHYFPKLSLGVVPALHDIAQGFPLVLLWPAFALMPGLAEELLFRGVLQRAIVKPALAVIASGVGFALFHVDPVHVVGVLPLGIFLAWVAQRSNTSVTIFAHVMNNSIALFSMQSAKLDVGYGTDRALPPEWLAASLLGAALAVWVVARETQSKAQQLA
jgi:membrane protease YdiL (CAAX protease family)